MDHPREKAKRVSLRLLAVAGTTVLTLMVSAAPSKATKPEPCPPGRYFVLNQSLLPADASSSDEAVVVGGTAISIGAACRAIPVKVWLSKSGTKIRARWKGCAGLQGYVPCSTTSSSRSSTTSSTTSPTTTTPQTPTTTTTATTAPTTSTTTTQDPTTTTVTSTTASEPSTASTTSTTITASTSTTTTQ